MVESIYRIRKIKVKPDGSEVFIEYEVKYQNNIRIKTEKSKEAPVTEFHQALDALIPEMAGRLGLSLSLGWNEASVTEVAFANETNDYVGVEVTLQAKLEGLDKEVVIKGTVSAISMVGVPVFLEACKHVSFCAEEYLRGRRAQLSLFDVNAPSATTPVETTTETEVASEKPKRGGRKPKAETITESTVESTPKPKRGRRTKAAVVANAIQNTADAAARPRRGRKPNTEKAEKPALAVVP